MARTNHVDLVNELLIVLSGKASDSVILVTDLNLGKTAKDDPKRRPPSPTTPPVDAMSAEAKRIAELEDQLRIQGEIMGQLLRLQSPKKRPTLSDFVDIR